jgi:hypothetical protein
LRRKPAEIGVGAELESTPNPKRKLGDKLAAAVVNCHDKVKGQWQLKLCSGSSPRRMTARSTIRYATRPFCSSHMAQSAGLGVMASAHGCDDSNGIGRPRYGSVEGGRLLACVYGCLCAPPRSLASCCLLLAACCLLGTACWALLGLALTLARTHQHHAPNGESTALRNSQAATAAIVLRSMRRFQPHRPTRTDADLNPVEHVWAYL